MSFTTYATAVAGTVLAAAFWNQQIRDNGNVIITSIDTASGRISGELKNHREEVTTIASAASVTLDLSLSNAFKTTALAVNVTAIAVTNWIAAKSHPVVWRVTQDGTGGRSLSGWPAAFKWDGGTAPTIAPAAGKTSIITMLSDDGGTTVFPQVYTLSA